MDSLNASPEVKMNAYVIMLHLRSQGWTNFTEIRKLLGWKFFKMAVAIDSVGYINKVIDYLSKKWDEPIPKMNAFVFTSVTESTDYICRNVYGKSGEEEQPRSKEVAEHAAKIAAYPNWDKIVEYLRRIAFDAHEK